jgi:hypothetical protein
MEFLYIALPYEHGEGRSGASSRGLGGREEGGGEDVGASPEVTLEEAPGGRGPGGGEGAGPGEDGARPPVVRLREGVAPGEHGEIREDTNGAVDGDPAVRSRDGDDVTGSWLSERLRDEAKGGAGDEGREHAVAEGEDGDRAAPEEEVADGLLKEQGVRGHAGSRG